MVWGKGTKDGRYPLSVRQKLFLRLYIKHGRRVATEATGYSYWAFYKIISHPETEGYLVSLLKRAVEDINLTLSDLLRKRYDMACDVSIDARLRNEILKDLTEVVRSAETEGGEDIRRLAFQGPMGYLKPSREVVSDVEEKVS